MKDMLPGYSKLIEQPQFTPTELCDLADADALLLENINGRPIVRNVQTRNEIAKRIYALRVAAQAIWLHHLEKP
jgi:hypothetical protein